MNYINIYNKIVEYRQSNLPENSYTEKHHIIPKCLGGDNSKENLVTVTTREHYLLHHLLVKIYPKVNGIISAFNAIKSRLNIEKTRKPYSCIRKCGYSKINTKRYNTKHSEKTKQKLSENNSRYWKGKHLPKEIKQKISETLKGKPLSEETKQKIAEQIKGRIWVNNGLIQKQVFPDNIPEGFIKGMLKKVYR